MKKLIFSFLFAVSLFFVHSAFAMSLVKNPDDGIYVNTSVAWDFNFADQTEKDSIIPTDATSWQLVVKDSHGETQAQSSVKGSTDTEADIPSTNYAENDTYELFAEWSGPNPGSYKVGEFTSEIPNAAYSAGRSPYQDVYTPDQPMSFSINIASLEDLYYLSGFSQTYANVDPIINYQFVIFDSGWQAQYSDPVPVDPANPTLNTSYTFSDARLDDYQAIYVALNFDSGGQTLALMELTPFTISSGIVAATSSSSEVASTTGLIVTTLKDNLIGILRDNITTIIILALLAWLVFRLWRYIKRMYK